MVSVYAPDPLSSFHHLVQAMSGRGLMLTLEPHDGSVSLPLSTLSACLSKQLRVLGIFTGYYK